MELVNDIKGEIENYITIREASIDLVLADNMLYVTKGNKAYRTECNCRCFVDTDRNLGMVIDDKYIVHPDGTFELR